MTRVTGPVPSRRATLVVQRWLTATSVWDDLTTLSLGNEASVTSTLNNGDRIRLKIETDDDFYATGTDGQENDIYEVSLTVGTYTTNWRVTLQDLTPNTFAFNHLFIDANTITYSSEIVLSGLTGGVTVPATLTWLQRDVVLAYALLQRYENGDWGGDLPLINRLEDNQSGLVGNGDRLRIETFMKDPDTADRNRVRLRVGTRSATLNISAR